jgi:hypothetical protein
MGFLLAGSSFNLPTSAHLKSHLILTFVCDDWACATWQKAPDN